MIDTAVTSGNDITGEALLIGPDVNEILDILEIRWGMESQHPHLEHEDPLDGLMLTLLSQNTNDRNRDNAFSRLKDIFPTWEEVYEADPEELVDILRPAGLANTKASRMRTIIEIIGDRLGEISLKKLKGFTREEVERFLRDMPGIGPKTIACVLVFDLGIPAFPVDTHVARFCRRVGWVASSSKPEDIQKIMEKRISPSRFHGAHLNIITHGRKICIARHPKCAECPARQLCAYGDR